MPTVGVVRDELFEKLGRTMTEEEFDELCFEYGIELDEVTTEENIKRKEHHREGEGVSEDEEVIYKIDIPANRYDLLCVEGLARALRVFKGWEEAVPQYECVLPAGGEGDVLKMVVKPETALVRPFVVAAVLRGVTFTERRYKSFIDLQDKLHQNLCKRRELVAIGTHDLSTVRAPFSYEAQPPEDIRFVPLKPAEQDREFSAGELLDWYEENDRNLRKFNHIIKDSVVYPCVRDADGVVLSLPPIINGAHSQITLDTRDVLIECTATDLNKASIVLDTVVAMFSEYCERPFTAEPVDVVYPDGATRRFPTLATKELTATVEYINRAIGVDLADAQIAELLTRMQLPAAVSGGGGAVDVRVPCVRSDVLHACDVAEDVAIAYGYNNIETVAPPTATQGKQLAVNHLSDLLRVQVAAAGYTEILTFVLCSYAESFEALRREDDRRTAVVISNPKGADFETVRSTLLTGILKTAGSNKDAPLPLKLFEVSDVVLLDSGAEVGARNERRLVALVANVTSGFEQVHGLMDRVMEVVGMPPGEPGSGEGYHIVENDDPTFFPGRQAAIVVRGRRVGVMGIVRPEVLANFDIVFPCSAVEMDIEWAVTL